MKRLLALNLACLIVLALAGMASAACADNNQIIMRLGASVNAHGALWDQSAYILKICYDSYFEAYTGTDAHSCDGADRLLNLSALINSHATFSDGGAYNMQICHKGLSECEAVSNTAQACTNLGTNLGKRAIVYISAATNAHITSALSPSGNPVSSNYPFVICCKGQGSAPPAPVIPEVCADYSSDIFPQYSGEANCTLDAFDVSKSCEGEANCRCAWDSATSSCIEAFDISEGSCVYSCKKEPLNYDTTPCIGGFKNVEIQATLVRVSGDVATCTKQSDARCTGGMSLMPCALESAQLPFFGFWQIVSSLIAIALVYLAFQGIKRAKR